MRGRRVGHGPVIAHSKTAGYRTARKARLAIAPYVNFHDAKWWLTRRIDNAIRGAIR